MSGFFPRVLTNRNRRLKLYPYSAASIGRKIGVIHGRDCWWEATGPALRDFEQLVPEIKQRLENYCEPVSGSDWVTFSIYMIGKEEQTATPTIMFFSTDSGPRKDAMNAIRKGGVLHQHPGFKIGNRALPPDVDSLIQPATERKIPQSALRESSPVEVYYDISKPIRAFGMAIFIKQDDIGPTSIRTATANVLRYGDQLLFLSVSHVFKKSPSSTEVAIDDYDSDYEIASDTDDEIDDSEDCDITSKGSLSPDNISESTLSDDDIADVSSARSYSSSDVSTQRNLIPHPQNQPSDSIDLSGINEALLSNQPARRTLNIISTTPPTPLPESLASLGSLVMSSVDKDWALIAITSEDVLVSLAALDTNGEDVFPTQVSPGPRATQIATYTLSAGYVTGTLSETPLYTRMPNSMSFQAVYKVQLDATLANGDCGSAIVDARTGDLYGHVVAGCEVTGIAYIMAAPHVFKDMEERLGGPLLLRWQDGPAEMKACESDHLDKLGCEDHPEIEAKFDKEPKLESHSPANQPGQTDRRVKSVDSLRLGYPRYSALLSTHPAFFVFRRFTRTRMRLLLQKQNEILSLLEALDKMDREEAVRLSLSYFLRDSNLARHQIVGKLTKALEEYGTLHPNHENFRYDG